MIELTYYKVITNKPILHSYKAGGKTVENLYPAGSFVKSYTDFKDLNTLLKGDITFRVIKDKKNRVVTRCAIGYEDIEIIRNYKVEFTTETKITL